MITPVPMSINPSVFIFTLVILLVISAIWKNYQDNKGDDE